MRMTIFLICCVLGIVTSFAYYMGAFKKVEVRDKLSPDFVFVFKKLQGSYKKSGKVMDEIYEWLKSQGIVTYRGIGLYYDNPKQVEEAQLRSVVGCILQKKDHGRIEDIAKKFHVKHFGARQASATNFPYRNKLSVLVGILKVYPALKAQGPVMEIYDISKGQIEYYHFSGQQNLLLTQYFHAY